MSYNLVKTQFVQNKAGWRRSFLDSFSQDEHGNALPWMTYPFIEFISQKLQLNHEIFEFGLGSSTLFFAKKVKKVTVIEDDEDWARAMQIKILQLDIKNIEIILMPDALTNFMYENCINDLHKNFDFIFVDSLKRFECVKNSYKFLKEGGALILDDSERKSYKKIFDFMAMQGFMQQDFLGIAPGGFRLKNTSYFTRPMFHKPRQ